MEDGKENADALKATSEKMKEYLERDLVSPRGEKFKMRSECSVGRNWAKYKKDKNEQGLRAIKD